MTTAYNKIQKEIIDYSQPEMLVKGVAGSGKTLCLLANAIQKAQESENVYFFTYNKTLEKYVKDMASGSGIMNINVTTFHAWAYKQLQNIYGRISTLSNYGNGQKKRLSMLDKAIEAVKYTYGGRFVTDEKYREFLLEEFEYMNTQYIKDYKEYSELARKGRGTEVRVTKKDREEIYAIFEYYQAEKYLKSSFEFSEFAARLLDNFDKLESKVEMEHIYIDEGQDLDKAQLLLLRKLSKKTYYIAADKGQKIYNTSYTWKEIGINILGGRTKIMTTSYRTTAQILELARCLQANDTILEDDDYIDASLEDMRSGPLPMVTLFDSKSHNDLLLKDIRASYDEDNEVVIGLLVETWYDANKYKRLLDNERIPCEQIKKEKGSTLSPGVKITTMHSSKGLEFDHVIIPNFKYEAKADEEDEESLNLLRRLYYVSFTRARNKLSIFVPKDKPSRFYDELKPSLYERSTIR